MRGSSVVAALGAPAFTALEVACWDDSSFFFSKGFNEDRGLVIMFSNPATASTNGRRLEQCLTVKESQQQQYDWIM